MPEISITIKTPVFLELDPIATNTLLVDDVEKELLVRRLVIMLNEQAKREADYLKSF